MKLHQLCAKILTSILTLFLLATPVDSASAASVSAASTTPYVESFTADYYIEPTDTTTNLRVVEDIVVIFSDSPMNHGIVRYIPTTNQGGRNVILKSLTESDLNLTRNGESEPIYSLEKSGTGASSVYILSTGTDEFITGRQEFTLEYTYENIITNYDSSGQIVSFAGDTLVDHQELYWNTNGTGWQTTFNSLTATIHFPSDFNWSNLKSDSASCHVGTYGVSSLTSSGSKTLNTRCEVTSDSAAKTFTFKTLNLTSGENLTFNLMLTAGSLPVADAARNYNAIYALAILLPLALMALLCAFKYRKTSRGRTYGKNLFVAPQYQPDPNFTVGEVARNSLYALPGSDKVATLIGAAVAGKIALQKPSVKKLTGAKWEITILNYDALNKQEINILKVLNRGETFGPGEVIMVKSSVLTAASPTQDRIMKANEDFELDTIFGLEHNGAILDRSASPEKFDDPAAASTAFPDKPQRLWKRIWYVQRYRTLAGVTCLNLFLAVILTAFVGAFAWVFIEGGSSEPAYLIPCLSIILLGSVVAFFITLQTSYLYKLHSWRTQKSYDLDNYTKGLKLYIAMAEKDRLAFHQSAHTAPLTPEGRVKLYEKLLPYAILFKLEDSWLKQLSKYYKQVSETYAPTWCVGFAVHDLNTFSRDFHQLHHTMTNIVTPTSTSTGIGSSTFSGGGGGGFSGGGGGGGGGGFR